MRRWLWRGALFAVVAGVHVCAVAGFTAGGTCYATGADAMAAYCRDFVPRVETNTPYVYSCASAYSDGLLSGVLVLHRATLATTAAAVATAHYYSRVPLAPCDETTVPTDADQVNATLLIFGAGLGLLAALWAGRKVYEFLGQGRRET